MGEIVSFPTKNKDDYIEVDDSDIIDEVVEKDVYLSRIKEFMKREDYEKVLCGILDKEIYDDLNETLQEIVDNYFYSC